VLPYHGLGDTGGERVGLWNRSVVFRVHMLVKKT
jgi:hypothetical protein